METATKPTELQIRNTIQDIKKRLKEPLMNKPVNKAVKQGYEEVTIFWCKAVKPMMGLTHCQFCGPELSLY